MIKTWIIRLIFISILFPGIANSIEQDTIVRLSLLHNFNENKTLISNFMRDFYQQMTPLLKESKKNSDSLFEKAYQKYLEEFYRHKNTGHSKCIENLIAKYSNKIQLE